jgi:hypothetical protein
MRDLFGMVSFFVWIVSTILCWAIVPNHHWWIAVPITAFLVMAVFLNTKPDENIPTKWRYHE